MLIFVFAGVSCGRPGPILAEFAAVPNVPSVETPTVAAADSTVRADAENPTPAAPAARLDGDVGKGEVEIGGPKGPEPTRYGDWERNGRCIDF
jgi:hypothetical protein